MSDISCLIVQTNLGHASALNTNSAVVDLRLAPRPSLCLLQDLIFGQAQSPEQVLDTALEGLMPFQLSLWRRFVKTEADRCSYSRMQSATLI
jgi:hypothetical protein